MENTLGKARESARVPPPERIFELTDGARLLDHEYNPNHRRQLDVDELKQLLSSLEYMQQELNSVNRA